MKKVILLSFSLLITMGLWAQVYVPAEGEQVQNEIQVKPPQFVGQTVTPTMSTQQSINDYVAANMTYPEQDLKYRIEGTETILFTVNTDGKLSDFKVVNSVSRAIDDEIIRVLNTTNGMWITGMNNDGPVAMQKEISVACKVIDEDSPAVQTDFQAAATHYFKKGSKLLYMKDRPQRALANFDSGIRYLPFDTNLRVMRGYARFALGDKEGAIADWKIVKEKANIDNLKMLADSHKDLDGYAELMAVLEH